VADIFDELEEDLKEQKIFDLWHKWGNWIIGAALLIVIGAAGVPVWKYYHHSIKTDESARYSNALALVQKGQNQDAQKILEELSANGKTGYAQLAALQLAALNQSAGSIDGALKIYQDLDLKNSSNLSFSGLAKVLSGYSGINSSQAGTIATQFTSLASSGNPFQGLSLELQGLYALEKGDKSKAAEDFNDILNAGYISRETSSRALLMMASLGISPELKPQNPTKE